MRFEVGVDFLRAFALKYDSGNADGAIPDCEVGDSTTARQLEKVVPFLDLWSVIDKDLANPDLRVTIVDADVHLHLG